MSRLDHVVDAVLCGSGAVPAPEPDVAGEPWPVASWQDGERGAVLTLVRRTDGSLHALVVAATRAEPAGWDIDAFAQSPWITDERGGSPARGRPWPGACTWRG